MWLYNVENTNFDLNKVQEIIGEENECHPKFNQDGQVCVIRYRRLQERW